MKYNLANKLEKSEAYRYFTILSNKKCMVEIKKVSPKRTLSQNSYLHLLLSAFGSHFGYTLEESKTIYKQLNASIYYYEKKGRRFAKSSAELTKEEMMKSIDVFMRKSAENGYELPQATDVEWLRQLENEVEKHNMYL